MENKTILEIFNSIIPLNSKEIELIFQKAKVESFTKKTTLLKLNHTCNHMYFVISGCLRLYYLKDDVERNCFFFHENNFCTAFGSFMQQRPSNQILQTIEDTTCLTISHADLEILYTLVPKMNTLVRKILEERYTNAHDIISSFILHNPEERYLEFINKYPLLVNRIPEYHISSYIGITPKSFSRLKGRIKKRFSVLQAKK